MRQVSDILEEPANRFGAETFIKLIGIVLREAQITNGKWLLLLEPCAFCKVRA